MRLGSGPREGKLVLGPPRASLDTAPTSVRGRGLPGWPLWPRLQLPVRVPAQQVHLGRSPGWTFLSRQPSGTLYPFQVGLALQVPGEAGAGWGGAL